MLMVLMVLLAVLLTNVHWPRGCARRLTSRGSLFGCSPTTCSRLLELLAASSVAFSDNRPYPIYSVGCAFGGQSFGSLPMNNVNAHARAGYEIMAPAGGFAALSAALAARADAVYFGVGALNMRARAAQGFTTADLPEIAGRCRDAGAKSYLTVNAIVYDKELALMREILHAAKDAGISAVIASDPAAILAARALDLEVHLSTQLSISNVEALRFYAPYADVAVLARELTLEQIAEVSREIERGKICGPSGELMRIECFCHGALCMAISGKCNLSYFTRGKSGNRGECVQNCRRKYRLTDIERGAVIDFDGRRFLSPKDLKTIGIMDRMVAAGIKVYKIEGRARSPEYVRTTVECYREALDAVLEGRWTEASRTAWDERLSSVFNRGFWEGWYLGAQTLEQTESDGSIATEKKVYCGRCLNFYAKSGIGYFQIEAQPIAKGDRFIVIGPTSGAVSGTVESLFVNDKPGELAVKGSEATFAVPERIRPGDRLFKLAPAEEAQHLKPSPEKAAL